LFNTSWESLGLEDSDAARLEQELIRNPLAGAVISGTGGLRKMRFALPGAGKSGSVRVCYSYFPEQELILLVVAYGKNQKADLSRAEKKAIAQLLREFEQRISGGESDNT